MYGSPLIMHYNKNAIYQPEQSLTMTVLEKL